MAGMTIGSSSTGTVEERLSSLRQFLIETMDRVDVLERKLAESQARIAPLEKKLGESQALLAKTREILALVSLVKVESSRLLITHGTAVHVEAPRAKFSSTGMGCDFHVNAKQFEVASNDAKFDSNNFVVDSLKTVIAGSGEISLSTSGTVKMQGGSGRLSFGSMKFETSLVDASDNIKCQVIQANNVVGQSYTPGAGNIW